MNPFGPDFHASESLPETSGPRNVDLTARPASGGPTDRPASKFDLGGIGISQAEYPALPDEAITNTEAGRLDPRRWFRDPSRPFELEIGPGKGTFLLQHAPAHPEINILGIEWEWEIYAYAADRMRRHGLTNVRILCADASSFVRWRCPSAIVRVLHLYFSDPWPKKKHHKNRVIQDRFLAEAFRILEPGGELRVVTDHDELWAWDQEHFARWVMAPDAPLNPADVEKARAGLPARVFEHRPFESPKWASEGELLGTNYERKFRRDDRPAHSCVLRKPSSVVL